MILTDEENKEMYELMKHQNSVSKHVITIETLNLDQDILAVIPMVENMESRQAIIAMLSGAISTAINITSLDKFIAITKKLWETYEEMENNS